MKIDVYLEYVKDSQNTTIKTKKKKKPTKLENKDMNKHFTKEDTQMPKNP